MKIAFIPPKGLEDRMSRGTAAMGLAQYGDVLGYATLLKNVSHSHFLMLDNGANEGAQVSSDRLREVASVTGAKEIVLPDVLGKEKETIEAVKNFLMSRGTAVGAAYMAVVQGTSMEEVKECVYAYNGYGTISTIGIPRLLVNINMSLRIDLANWIANTFGNRFKIHLLGTNPAWPREVYHVARYAPHVRSVDTSMPYNYAIANRALSATTSTQVAVNRPLDYFSRNWAGFIDMKLIKENEDTMLRWVSPVDRSA